MATDAFCCPIHRRSLSIRNLSDHAKLDAECNDYLGTSLFVVGEFGGNDYTTPIFAGRSMWEVYTFVPRVVQAIAHGVEVCR